MPDLENSALIIRLFEHSLSEDPQVRAAAYRALGTFEPEDSIVSCLLNGIDDENSTVRREAGKVLIRFGYLDRVK